MASSIQFFPSFLFTFLIFFLFICPSHSSSHDSVLASTSFDPDNVNLTLYYESLCPDSATFIIDNITNAYVNGIIDITNLRLIPWGNAKLNNDRSFECQHGPDECLLNTVEACAIDVWPELTTYMSFISCIELEVYQKKHREWETCFFWTALPEKPIADCYKGKHGKELELKYAEETSKLNPPHKFVPWVVVNDKALGEDYMNFVQYVCEAYKGKHLPQACDSSQYKTKSSEKLISSPQSVTPPKPMSFPQSVSPPKPMSFPQSVSPPKLMSFPPSVPPPKLMSYPQSVLPPQIPQSKTISSEKKTSSSQSYSTPPAPKTFRT